MIINILICLFQIQSDAGIEVHIPFLVLFLMLLDVKVHNLYLYYRVLIF